MGSWVVFVSIMLLAGLRGRTPLLLAAGLKFDINSEFSCGSRGNLLCQGNATTTGKGELKLTADPLNRDELPSDFYANNVGVALYSKPLQVLRRFKNQSASFSTSFSFKIEPAFIYKNETTNVTYYSPGDGMAFVMFASSSWIGDPGQDLGFSRDAPLNVPRKLAVEFDTYMNSFDIDDNHVGIDIENVTSRQARSASDLNITMYFSDKLFAWVDYNASVSILEVRISRHISRPSEAFISYPLSLSDVFDEELVWVGFSGSNGACICHNYYTIEDWKFTSFFSSSPSPVPPSARAPKPASAAAPLISASPASAAAPLTSASPDRAPLISLPLASTIAPSPSVSASAGREHRGGALAFVALLCAILVQ